MARLLLAATGAFVTQVPAASPPAGGCALDDGSVVRCATTGDIFLIEEGQRRYFSADAFAFYGSPEADYEDSGSCTTIDACPEGPVMPTGAASSLQTQHTEGGGYCRVVPPLHCTHYDRRILAWIGCLWLQVAGRHSVLLLQSVAALVCCADGAPILHPGIPYVELSCHTGGPCGAETESAQFPAATATNSFAVAAANDIGFYTIYNRTWLTQALGQSSVSQSMITFSWAMPGTLLHGSLAGLYQCLLASWQQTLFLPHGFMGRQWAQQPSQQHRLCWASLTSSRLGPSPIRFQPQFLQYSQSTHIQVLYLLQEPDISLEQLDELSSALMAQPGFWEGLEATLKAALGVGLEEGSGRRLLQDDIVNDPGLRYTDYEAGNKEGGVGTPGLAAAACHDVMPAT